MIYNGSYEIEHTEYDLMTLINNIGYERSDLVLTKLNIVYTLYNFWILYGIFIKLTATIRHHEKKYQQQ